MFSKVLVVLLPLFLSQLVSHYFPMDWVWLGNLQQSALTPPPIVFGPIWTVLYTLIGWSLTNYPHDWLTLNLLLNLSWLITFHHRQLGNSFLILLLMAITLLFYLQITKNWLLIPYLAWILLASYLNGHLWLVNRSAPPKQIETQS